MKVQWYTFDTHKAAVEQDWIVRYYPGDVMVVTCKLGLSFGPGQLSADISLYAGTELPANWFWV